MWAAVTGLLGKFLDLLKPALAFFYVRRATKIEDDRDDLKETAEVQKQQIEIASRPADPPSTVRDRMRNGGL